MPEKLHTGCKSNVTLSREAFIIMVISAIETYKKETFGLLVGSAHKKHYMIRHAIPHQKAQRAYEFVNIKARDVNRINAALGCMTDQLLVGDYHAHPEGPEHLSPFDKEEFKKSGTPLAVIVIVKKTMRRHKWRRNEDMSISGSIGKVWWIKIHAYEYDKKLDRIHGIKIVCPYLFTLNMITKFKPERPAP